LSRHRPKETETGTKNNGLGDAFTGYLSRGGSPQHDSLDAIDLPSEDDHSFGQPAWNCNNIPGRLFSAALQKVRNDPGHLLTMAAEW
jgi:hypothetical protein